MDIKSKSIERVLLKAKKIAAGFFDASCDVFSFKEETDLKTGICTTSEEVLYLKIPCKIVEKSLGISEKLPEGLGVFQTFTVFFAPDILLPEGCRIKIFEAGKELSLYLSGSPSYFKTHMEVKALAYKDFA